MLASDDARRKKKPRPTFCNNCGECTHTSKACPQPVISCGVVMFRRDDAAERERAAAALDERTHRLYGLHDAALLAPAPADRSLRYLLVRRRDSMSLVEFVRGKYDPSDVRFLHQMFSEMAQGERERLRGVSFSVLWTTMWSCTSTSNFDYDVARGKFERIRAGYRLQDGRQVSIERLLRDTSTPYLEPEWGFPKGKRNRRESDLECARRECCEETGCGRDDFWVLHQLGSTWEEFRGSNGVLYRHNYFVARFAGGAEVRVDSDNAHQASEIGDIGWFTLGEAMRKFRPYDIEKKVMLAKLDNVLSNHAFAEEHVLTL